MLEWLSRQVYGYFVAIKASPAHYGQENVDGRQLNGWRGNVFVFTESVQSSTLSLHIIKSLNILRSAGTA